MGRCEGDLSRTPPLGITSLRLQSARCLTCRQTEDVGRLARAAAKELGVPHSAWVLAGRLVDIASEFPTTAWGYRPRSVKRLPCRADQWQIQQTRYRYPNGPHSPPTQGLRGRVFGLSFLPRGLALCPSSVRNDIQHEKPERRKAAFEGCLSLRFLPSPWDLRYVTQPREASLRLMASRKARRSVSLATRLT